MRRNARQPLVPTLCVAAGGFCRIAATIILALCAAAATCFAGEQDSSSRERATRAIYVPFSELHVLLQQQPKRVLLGRAEYDELVKKAKKTPENHAPRAAVIVSADYAVTAGGQRAEIRGVLAIDVLEEGLHSLSLDLGSVGLENATLDNHSASIGRNAAGQLVLFVEGVGRHELTLDMVAPLETTAARQVLNFRLSRPAAAKLQLTVAGDVEIKAGADVISRVVDAAAKVTRFELLPRDGDTSVVMTLNSHLQQQDRAVVARSVLVDEITQAYEKLYATVSLGILYRAVDQFSFIVPEGFEITEVSSPLLARWDVRTEEGRKILGVKLREQTTETVVLKIAAIRTPAKLENWSAPRLDPLDVVGSVTVFGLLVEDRLKAESLSARGLIPIDTAVLGDVLPANLLRPSPTQPALRSVAAWYAPQSDFSVTAQYKKPPAEMAVTTSLLLVVADKGQEVLGGLAFLPQVEERFSFDVLVPAGWQITSVTAADGQALPFERYADGPHPNPLPKGEGTKNETSKSDGTGRIRVTVPNGMAIGQEYKANFRAVCTPPGWLGQWKSFPVKFPKFVVLDATRDIGAVAVDVRDDFDVRSEKLSQLIPLDAVEKPKYGLAGVNTRLAYRYESPKYAASLTIERNRPRLTARTFSFVRVEPSALDCHYELVYTIAEARTQRLAFLLPKDTPASVSIAALDGVKLKEYTPEIVGNQRRWNVSLVEAARGRVRLAVDFQQPLPSREPVGYSLPIVAAADVAYQSGLAAVEGCAELEVKVDTSARQVDVGELADAEYQPGRRLLGAYGFVGDPSAVKIDVLRHPGYGLYPVIVQQCELDTNLSPDGQSQTQARFKLLTKALFLQVKLPPKAELWSAELDGVPLKPQRQGDSLLIDVPAGKSDAPQTLQIVYAAPVDAVASRGTVAVSAPKLFLRAEEKIAAVEVPLADLVWRLHLPNGYDLVGTGGTVATDEVERPSPAAVQVAKFLLGCNEDLSRCSLFCPVVFYARRTPRLSENMSKELGGLDYGAANRAAIPPRSVLAEASDEMESQLNESFVQFGGKTPNADSDGKISGEFAAKRKASRDARYSSFGGLLGVASLKIDVVQSPQGTDSVRTFRSLGVDPELVVTLVKQSRLSSLGWGLALLVGLIGVAITRRPTRKKTTFVLIVAVLATVVPLATGGIEIALVCNMLFYAACLLVPYYLVAGVVRSSTAMLLVALVMASACANPQAACAANPESADGPYVIHVVEPAGSVKVPEDAVIVPYDPDLKDGVKSADRVLVPYDKYVELWNRVHPDKKIETKAPPAPYALAGATYKTLLEGDEYLLVTGQLEIDVFSDDFVTIPLGLGGGVLAQAELDGKPARLSVAVAKSPPMQQAAAKSSIHDRSLAVLYVSGKGRHKLDLSVRLKLLREGGWRVVQGVLPAAPASSLSIVVPKPHTELRLGQMLDRRKYDTEKTDETIRTTLGVDGAVSISWRPVVAEGQIDRSLTAVSAAVFDVQEDGLRLVWRLGLEFRRSQRERFTVNLPDGYLLEKVEGNNVRGWEIHKTDRGQTVEVTLLQPAKDNEQFTLRLWRAGSVGRKKMAQFDVPQVTVTDAALHTGQLTLRRSPLLELRTLDRSGVTRTDLPADNTEYLAAAGVEESPLGIQPFEAYTFAAVPFTVRLAATPITAHVSASVQTILKLGEFERRLESRILFDVQGRRAYQLRMLLPDDLRVDHVSAPGEFHYAITKFDGRSLLTIYLATGQQGDVPVVVRGRLGHEKTLTELSLPRLEVLDVDRQQGDVAVQVDPAFDVEAVKLTNCEPVLLGQLSAWLNSEQQRVTRLGLHYRQGNYAGTLRLRLRNPVVTCDTITNVRLTDRALEETILLDFTINNAGIRKLSFLLPAEMADSRISVAMLRQKSVEAVSKEPGSPVRVTIELQDEVMGQLHVLVENDRLLTPGSHDAPIPVVELGRTNRRYVVIENAGRDEVAVEQDKLPDMDALGNRQKEWVTLRSIFGREMTMAYLVSSDARQPRLVFHTESHSSVETVKAQIGLAETTLVVDDNGAYRAQQTLRIDNATEQFLKIRLPEGAELWTARVAGEAVKPIKASGASGVRIPLIKTALGDLYYDVVLKYGGKMPALGTIGNVDFPLIRCVNITPNLSQVRLYVPKDHQWFDFGGTMRQVVEEADLQAGYVSFQTNQLKQISLALHQGDKWTKARAGANLKAQQVQMDQYRSSISPDSSNPYLQSELAANGSMNAQVLQELEKQERSPVENESLDNREQLNKRFQSQKTERARNVVTELGANFYTGDSTVKDQSRLAGEPAQQFNGKWMNQNKLADRKEPMNEIAGPGKARDVDAEALYMGSEKKSVTQRQVTSGATFTVSQQPSAAQVVQDAPQQQPLNAIAGRLENLDRKSDSQQDGVPQGEKKSERQKVDRYKSRLNQQLGLAVESTNSMPNEPNRPARPFSVSSAASLPQGVGFDPFSPDDLPATNAPAPAESVPLNQSEKPASGPISKANAVQQAAAGLASLDFALPTGESSRWTLYRFTTPLGNQEITARNASNELVRRLVEVVAVFVVLLLVWLVAVMIRRGSFYWLSRPTGLTLLICLGLLSLCGGILPLAGLAAIAVGCGLTIQQWTSARAGA